MHLLENSFDGFTMSAGGCPRAWNLRGEEDEMPSGEGGGVGGSFSSYTHRGHVQRPCSGATSVGSCSRVVLRISIHGSLRVTGIFLKDQWGKIQGSLRSYFGIVLGHIQVA